MCAPCAPKRAPARHRGPPAPVYVSLHAATPPLHAPTPPLHAPRAALRARWTPLQRREAHRSAPGASLRGRAAILRTRSARRRAKAAALQARPGVLRAGSAVLRRCGAVLRAASLRGRAALAQGLSIFANPDRLRSSTEGAPPIPTRNVNLTAELDRFVSETIASGRYENASEVIRAGLRALEEREQLHQAKLAALRGALEEGEKSGIAEGDVFQRVRAQLGRAAL